MAIKKSQLYSLLWESCNVLRGSMDASQYKDYVLVILFIKYISDKAKDPSSMINVPAGCSFSDMVNLKNKPGIGDALNTIIRKLADANDLQGVITNADFDDDQKLGKDKDKVETISRLIAVFENKDLEAAQERCRLLAEPVAQPRKEDEFFDYFGFNQTTTPTDEQEAEIIRNAQKRDEFYDACNRLVRTFRAISMQMSEAGYSSQEASDILREVKYFDDVRMALMLRCGDYLDLKRYDAEMRALLDDYIEAHDAVKMDELSDFSFLEIIQTDEDSDEEESNLTNVVGSEKGVAETIAANVRRVINRKKESNPEEYRLFSERLNRLLEELHQGAITYKAFLQTMRELMLLLRNKVQVDPRLDTDGKRSLYDNCGHDVEFALYLYDVIKANAKHNFRNNRMRKRMLLSAITEAVADKQKVDVASPEEILSIVVANQEFGS